MPNNDPGLWRAIHDALAQLWPHIYATALSFIVALLRAQISGGKITHSLLEACLCGSLTLAVFPVLDYFGLDLSLAVAIGASISFLGVDWFRHYLADTLRKLLEHWSSK